MITFKEWEQLKDTFYGTTKYYPLLNSLYLTDGTKTMADKLECYWIFDNIAIYDHFIEQYDIVVVKIIAKENKATIEFLDGNDKGLALIPVQYTDLPDGEYEVWACKTELKGKKAYVACLPRER